MWKGIEREGRPWGRRRRSSAGGRRPRSSTPSTASSSPLPPFVARSAAASPSEETRVRDDAWRGERGERRGGGDGTATSGKGRRQNRRGWPAVDGAGSPVPDPHGHTGPPRASPRSRAVRRAIDGADCRQAWLRGVGPTSCARDVPSGWSRAFPFPKGVRWHVRPGAYNALTPPGACNQTQHFHTNLGRFS